MGLGDNTCVLVTGAAGFIGAFLCKRLLGQTGCQVVGYDNLSEYYDLRLKRARLEMLREADAGRGRFSFVHADLCNQGALEGVFSRHKPSIVVNLAAQAGVRWSIDHPRDYADSNLVGFLNVLECCRHHGVRHLVYASSSSVYGDSTEVPFSEDARCDAPVSLYAATKRSNELLAHSYAQLYGIPSTGLRFFTVYGPMGRPDMAYFKFADRMVAGLPIQLYNDGDMMRDFTYVEDIVDGLVRVLAGDPPRKEAEGPLAGTPHRILNIGHGSPQGLGEFVRTLEDALRSRGIVTGEVSYESLPMQPGDVHVTFADTRRLEALYGYRPQTTLAEGLSAFADWYAGWVRCRSHAWISPEA